MRRYRVLTLFFGLGLFLGSAQSFGSRDVSALDHPEYFSVLSAHELASEKLKNIALIPERDRALWENILPFAIRFHSARLALLDGDSVQFREAVSHFDQNNISGLYVPKVSFLYHLAISSDLEIGNYAHFNSWYSFAKTNGMLGVGISNQDEMRLAASLYYANRDQEALSLIARSLEPSNSLSAAYAGWLMSRMTQRTSDIEYAISLHKKFELTDIQDELRLIDLETMRFANSAIAKSETDEATLASEFTRLEAKLSGIRMRIDSLQYPLIYSQSLEVLSDLYSSAVFLLPHCKAGIYEKKRLHLGKVIANYR